MHLLVVPFRSIPTGKVKYDPSATRMYFDILRYIVDYALNNHPAVIHVVVIFNVLLGELSHKLFNYSLRDGKSCQEGPPHHIRLLT